MPKRRVRRNRRRGSHAIFMSQPNVVAALIEKAASALRGNATPCHVMACATRIIHLRQSSAGAQLRSCLPLLKSP